MGEEEPEAEDWLGKDVENGIADDLGINTDDVAALGETPDNWVDGPQNEGEAGNGTIESLGLAVLLCNRCSATNGELVDNNDVGNASEDEPAPLAALNALAKSTKETSQDHDDISDNGNQDVGTAEASKEGEIEEKKWGCDAPVDISCPVDLAVDFNVNIGNLLVLLNFRVRRPTDAITTSHGVVGEKGKGGD